jgi:hypothetical protein
MPSVSNPDASRVRKITAEGLFRLDQSSFISVLGDIFEHSPWVAEGPFRPFADADALHKRMVEVVRNASRRGSTILSARTLILPERLRSRAKSRMPRSTSRRVPDLAALRRTNSCGFRS